jgi:GPI mannosyltransferase 3
LAYFFISPPWAIRFGFSRSRAGDFARDKPVPAWKWLYATAAGALALRLAVALWSVRIGHPDEVFQYLEQAHRLVYGYGFIPWEYRFGLRNWLLPGVLAGLLEFLRLLHIDQPAAYIPILNSVFAVVSVSVVFSSYAIGRSLFGESAGRAAAVVAAIWHELLYASTAPRPEILAAYAAFGALAISVTGAGLRRAIWTGLLLGAAVALRPQYALAVAGIWAYALLRWRRQYALSLSMSCLAIPLFAGLLDLWFWGEPFVSYVNYFLFNSAYGVSELFGDEPGYWYAYRLTVASLGLYPLAIGYGVIAWKRCWPLLLLSACVLLPHSLIAHKEDRFVFLAILPLLPLLADLFANGLPWARHIVTAWIGAVVVLGCTYGGVLNRDDHLNAWLDLSRRNDVKAVLDLTGPAWKSGGYYYLHRDVPVYFSQVLGQLPKSDLRLFVSHIIVAAPAASIPGFRVESVHRDIAVLAQISPPANYRRLQTNTREMPVPAIDGRFSPSVHAAF